MDERRQPFADCTSRMTRERHVRIWERLGVQFPGPTRPEDTYSTSVSDLRRICISCGKARCSIRGGCAEIGSRGMGHRPIALDPDECRIYQAASRVCCILRGRLVRQTCHCRPRGRFVPSLSRVTEPEIVCASHATLAFGRNGLVHQLLRGRPLAKRQEH